MRTTTRRRTIRRQGDAGDPTGGVQEGDARQPEEDHAVLESGPGGAPGEDLNFNAALAGTPPARSVRADMRMTIEELDGKLVRISLEGRMDLEGTQVIDQKFAYATSTHALRLAVDLSNVTFVASIGMRTLLTAARAQAGRGGKMVLIAPNVMVRHTLEIAGIDRIVPILSDWETARSHLQTA